MVKHNHNSVKDVEQSSMVKAVASFLKKTGKVKEPEWSDLVKLSVHKELAPSDPDWFYTRTASIARRLYVRSPAGIGAFTKVFGGKKRRGVAPNHFQTSHRNNIRKALQALETIKWVEKVEGGQRGRQLTSTGRKELDRIAKTIKEQEIEAKEAAELA